MDRLRGVGLLIGRMGERDCACACACVCDCDCALSAKGTCGTCFEGYSRTEVSTRLPPPEVEGGAATTQFTPVRRGGGGGGGG